MSSVTELAVSPPKPWALNTPKLILETPEIGLSIFNSFLYLDKTKDLLFNVRGQKLLSETPEIKGDRKSVV